MKTRHISTMAAAVVCAAAMSACVHSYQKDIDARLRKQFGTADHGRSINGYQFAALLPPVGTLFCKNGVDAWPIMPDLGCRYGTVDQYFVTSLSRAEKDALLKAMISQDAGGSVSLSDDVTSDVKFDLAMPLVGSIANIAANAEIRKHTTVTITGGKTWRRTVNWDRIREAHDRGQLTSIMVEHLQKKDFVLAASDIVIEDYRATVTIDNRISATAKAALLEHFDVLAKDSSLSVDADSRHTGTYVVSSTQAVIVAALYVLPPAGQLLVAGGTDVTRWPRAHFSDSQGRTFVAR